MKGYALTSFGDSEQSMDGVRTHAIVLFIPHLKAVHYSIHTQPLATPPPLHQSGVPQDGQGTQTADSEATAGHPVHGRPWTHPCIFNEARVLWYAVVSSNVRFWALMQI
jgi:hypothetical protein